MGTTASPADARAAFLAERKTGIGGSDAGTIMGVNPYKSRLQLWREKTGRAPDETPMNGNLKRGIKLEAAAATEFMEIMEEQGTPVKLHRVNSLLRHPEHPWMIGHVDRRIVGQSAIAEIKCPSLGAYSKVKREGINESYILQAQHYMAVGGFAEARWLIFCADRWELLDFPMQRDELLIDRLIEAERDFWRYVETDTEPPAEETLPEIEIERAKGTVLTREDPAFLEAADQLAEAKELKEQAENLYDAAKEKLIELVKDNGFGGYAGGRVLFYWQQQAGRVSFDRKALAAARPLDPAKVRAWIDEQFHLHADTITANLAACRLDLDQFEKQGQPFTVFKPYFREEV